MPRRTRIARGNAALYLVPLNLEALNVLAAGYCALPMRVARNPGTGFVLSLQPCRHQRRRQGPARMSPVRKAAVDELAVCRRVKPVIPCGARCAASLNMPKQILPCAPKEVPWGRSE